MTRKRRPPPRVIQHLRGPCPDCCARFNNDRELIHEPTCPLGKSIEDTCDDDRRWFADNPGETVRIRAATHAEVQDLTHLAPTVARPTRVHVHNLAWGRSRRFISAGDDQMLILDTD